MPKPKESGTNGALKITSKGFCLIQIGEAQAFKVDLILAHNRRVQIDKDHPGAEIPHYITLIAEVGGPAGCSAAEALEFVSIVSREAEDLSKGFFWNASSPENTASTVSASHNGKSPSCEPTSIESGPATCSAIPNMGEHSGPKTSTI